MHHLHVDPGVQVEGERFPRMKRQLPPGIHRPSVPLSCISRIRRPLRIKKTVERLLLGLDDLGIDPFWRLIVPLRVVFCRVVLAAFAFLVGCADFLIDAGNLEAKATGKEVVSDSQGCLPDPSAARTMSGFGVFKDVLR